MLLREQQDKLNNLLKDLDELERLKKLKKEEQNKLEALVSNKFKDFFLPILNKEIEKFKQENQGVEMLEDSFYCNLKTIDYDSDLEMYNLQSPEFFEKHFNVNVKELKLFNGIAGATFCFYYQPKDKRKRSNSISYNLRLLDNLTDEDFINFDLDETLKHYEVSFKKIYFNNYEIILKKKTMGQQLIDNI